MINETHHSVGQATQTPEPTPTPAGYRGQTLTAAAPGSAVLA